MPISTTGGFLLANKPVGPTSHDIVKQVRRSAAPFRVGHTGTLDPRASGLLIIVLGQATRLTPYAHAHNKKYRATLTLGATSTTDDSAGTITDVASLKPEQKEIEAAIETLTGQYLQTPPRFSAIQYQGIRWYRRAKKEFPEQGSGPAPRLVTIHSITIIEYYYPYVAIEVECSTGTYIRALARDLGQKLSTGAYLSELKRTKIGSFDISQAISPDDISVDSLPYLVRPSLELVEYLPTYHLTDQTASQLRHGKVVEVPDPLTQPWYKLVDRSSSLVGIGTAGNNTHLLRAKIIIKP